MKEMAKDMIRRHKWRLNIPLPFTPPHYDPNEPPFDPSQILGDFDLDEFESD